MLFLALAGLAGEQRQVNCEGRALALAAVHAQRSAMAVEDVLDDGKPQPGSACFPALRNIDTLSLRADQLAFDRASGTRLVGDDGDR